MQGANATTTTAGQGMAVRESSSRPSRRRWAAALIVGVQLTLVGAAPASAHNWLDYLGVGGTCGITASHSHSSSHIDGKSVLGPGVTGGMCTGLHARIRFKQTAGGPWVVKSTTWVIEMGGWNGASTIHNGSWALFEISIHQYRGTDLVWYQGHRYH